MKTSLPEGFPTHKHTHMGSGVSPKKDQDSFHSPNQIFIQEILALPRVINLLFYKASSEISKLTQNSDEISKLT